jgi:hypothetical protein
MVIFLDRFATQIDMPYPVSIMGSKFATSKKLSWCQIFLALLAADGRFSFAVNMQTITAEDS